MSDEMRDDASEAGMSRRGLLRTAGKMALASVTMAPLAHTVFVVPDVLGARAPELAAVAGLDRIAVLPGRTYLNGWAGYYGEPTGRRSRFDSGERGCRAPGDRARLRGAHADVEGGRPRRPGDTNEGAARPRERQDCRLADVSRSGTARSCTTSRRWIRTSRRCWRPPRRSRPSGGLTYWAVSW